MKRRARGGTKAVSKLLRGGKDKEGPKDAKENSETSDAAKKDKKSGKKSNDAADSPVPASPVVIMDALETSSPKQSKKNLSRRAEVTDGEEDEGSIDATLNQLTRQRGLPSSDASHQNTAGAERPNYRGYNFNGSQRDMIEEGDEGEYDENDYDGEDGQVVNKAKNIERSAGTHRLQRILNQAHQTPATQQQNQPEQPSHQGADAYLFDTNQQAQQQQQAQTKRAMLQKERISDVKNLQQITRFVARVVMPPLRVDPFSTGGQYLMPATPGATATATALATTENNTILSYNTLNMQQECLLCLSCQSFESTGTTTVALHALQYPAEWTKHKRALGLFSGGAAHASAVTATASSKRGIKLRFVILARSTNQPLLPQEKTEPIFHHGIYPQGNHQKLEAEQQQDEQQQSQQDKLDDGAERDYDTMFAPDDAIMADDVVCKGELSSSSLLESPEKEDAGASRRRSTISAVSLGDDSEATEPMQDDDVDQKKDGPDATANDRKRVAVDAAIALEKSEEKQEEKQEAVEEISSFPVLVLMTLNADGTSPDVRKLIPLQDLTTIQDLHATVLQLAFINGDTIRLDFGQTGADESKAAEGSLDKERFIWSLMQVHAMLCVSVVERNSMESAGRRGRMILPPLNVLNLDRAELQYVATVNGFLRKSATLRSLLDRHRAMIGGVDEEQQLLAHATNNAKIDLEEMDRISYDLMLGRFDMRISLFQSEEERKDAEEILNSTEWTSSLSKEETAAVSVAERLGTMLQERMRDLEAETCRRLIAWEDEKHLSTTGGAKLFTKSDERDTVDALALASLFKTLEALDSDLEDLENWLQARAAAIKPLTDDCADIEEENRQLEQQWKSYDMLGTEMQRLLQGSLIDENVEKILKNPASALVYDDDGRVDVDESESGIEEIYEAGKALQEAMEYPRRSGGLHLESVSERADGLSQIASSFCTALAHIIVTVMEQFNEEVLAGSDYGKVSKNDTHAMIAKKIRDTQRKFQSALLGYIKLIEILAALSPDMLPALRDAYSEMVAESILMKKRMKGYFQALPGKNAAYMNKAGKDLKDYAAFSNVEVFETVNSPDIRNALSELLPVIAREAYFTSALFGAASKDQDGREKKRNFESTRLSVDNASQHFRYYIERTCGILPDSIGGKSTIEKGVKGDPLLCLVGSIYLNEAMDNYIDREKKGGDHSLSLAYIRATILELRKKADKQWVGWVEKQIEWIRANDGVPLNGKRAGVFPSFARFPCYLDHVLKACKEGREDGYQPDFINIKVINYYMQKIAAALLESLRECASRDTTDQQYACNVMQMECAYFFTQSIKNRGDLMMDLFAKQVAKANSICKDSTDAYLGWMIKREFVTLHELFSKVSKLRREVGDKQVGTHVPKSLFVKTLQKEANKDIMKDKISVMYTRMEKHVSEEGSLLPVAWKALVKVLYEWFGRWEKMSTQIYGHKLNPSAVDIVRIAKAAGGAGKPKSSLTSSGNDFAFKAFLKLGDKGGQ
jgi:hypothetical protein